MIQPERTEKSRLPALLACVGVSLLLRLAAWLWTTRQGVAPHLDEPYYWERAQAWTQLLSGHPEAWSAAYGRGIWPPLHPFLLGLAGLLAPGSLAFARLVGVLFSVLTTAALFKLGNQVGGKGVGVVAALAHALYLPLIFFAPLLYSESLYLLLLVCSLFYLFKFYDTEDTKHAALCGLLMGLMVLTRPSGAFFPLALALAALLYKQDFGEHTLAFLAPPAILAFAWMATMRLQEDRWVALSTSAGYNFYLGNNKFIEPGHGSAWAQHRVLPKLQKPLMKESGATHMADWDQVAAKHGWEVVRADPNAAAERAGYRVLETLGPDIYLRRYMYDHVLPRELWLVKLDRYGAWTHFALLGLGLIGLYVTRYRGSFVLALLAGLMGPILSIGSSRFGLPLMTLLLVPAAYAVNVFWGRCEWEVRSTPLAFRI